MIYYLDPREGAARRNRLTGRVSDLLSDLSEDGPTRRLGQRWTCAQSTGGHYGARVGDIGGLEAANLESSHPGRWLGQAARIGLLVAVWGLTRRGVAGLGLRAVGAGLVMSRLKDRAGVPRRIGERRRTVDIQKTLRIEATVDQVYAFWRNYRNFPLFLSRVRLVEDLGAGRSRWVVDGPEGRLEWKAMITVEAPGALLAWRSEPGAVLENAGAVRFSPEGTGTRLDLRFCYNPPTQAGAAVAELFGADPRAQLNQDLVRLKSLLESTTRSEMYGQESGA
jgi:uncharacterized membrane protein